jgi:endonuclease YncB( thermonuclease family)
MMIKITLILIAATLITAAIVYLLKTKETVPENYQSITFENVFKVTEIVDGDTFKIDPGWKWNGKTGNTIRPLGYDTPEKGEPEFNETTEKLKQLLLNQEVELKNPIKLSYDRLLCDVYFKNKNLADFFPEYLAEEFDIDSGHEYV